MNPISTFWKPDASWEPTEDRSMAKRPTVKQIAELTGVSPTAVSFVLNGRSMGISEETSERILRVAFELGYSRNNRLTMKDWLRVAYVPTRIARLSNQTTFFQEVYNHLQNLSEKNRIELLIRELDIEASPERMFLQLDLLQRQDIDIFVTSSIGVAKVLVSKGLKVVLAQTGGHLDGCINISCDDYAAGALAAEHAYACGHREAGTIFFHHESPRFKGFKEKFTALGGTCPENFQWTVPTDHQKAAETVADLARQAGTLPTLFYCFADNIVFVAIRGFRQCGLSVPDDVSLIGTDNLYWGKLSSPAFTTIDLCEQLFAEKLVQAVKDAAEGVAPYRLAVPVKLLSRETVRCLN